MTSSDTRFSNAIHAAAHGSPETLAEIVRSDFELGSNERKMLADLISGEMQLRQGRPSNPINSPRVVAALEMFRKAKRGKQSVTEIDWKTETGFALRRIQEFNMEALEQARAIHNAINASLREDRALLDKIKWIEQTGFSLEEIEGK